MEPVNEKSLSKVFSYKGMDVSFARKNGVVMVNATEMAKRFNETPSHWFELVGTRDFIIELAKERGVKANGQISTSLNVRELAMIYPTLVNVVKGGNVANVTQGYVDARRCCY